MLLAYQKTRFTNLRFQQKIARIILSVPSISKNMIFTGTMLCHLFLRLLRQRGTPDYIVPRAEEIVKQVMKFLLVGMQKARSLLIDKGTGLIALPA